MEKKELLKNGKRIDGRLPEELRPVEMRVGVVSRANGSAMVRFGDTVAIASVYGPRALFPKHLQEQETCIVRCRYNMAPFSVDERKPPGPDRRSIELTKVIRLALEPVIFLEDFPRATIDVFVEIIQADGSTRVTAINAASLALASAGVPMRDLVAACSVGKINGTLILDLNGEEDKNSEADLAFAMMPSKNKITLLQMDGNLSREEIEKLMEIAKNACKKIYEMQRSVLKEKYRRVE
ncbi:MAG: exosome complex exonuclease Rrp41 [Candidatus Aenigmarchaeota archaeon]|nr:exosome complex exonuclease Rrp41 [Candidatus Aenigmarchaeota archaeon]